MPWTEMIFRGKDRVWALVDEDGELVLDTGRATMKYRPDESAKTYSAAAQNLSAPGASERAPAPPRPSANRPEFDELIWKSPVGEVVRSTELPDELSSLDGPESDIAEFHTDGACSGNPGRCGWGFVMRRGGEYLEAHQFLGIGTNNIAELMGIKAAMDEVPHADAVLRIYTDSNYAIGVLTKDWKAKANTDLVKTIRAQLRRYSTMPQLIKVKGHAGDPLNERADLMATSSIRP